MIHVSKFIHCYELWFMFKCFNVCGRSWSACQGRDLNPCDGGKGPTKTMCMTSERVPGVRVDRSGVIVCRWTWTRWHCTQEHIQWQTSEFMPGHTYPSSEEFQIPGWERPCRESNTVRHQASYTRDYCVLVGVSQ